ncbi:McrB family protein [Treponema berlinense]|uniref:McrB family protein n=1 Tax=Treponema berlinense TaxID=225004 RepID=UPI003F0869F9
MTFQEFIESAKQLTIGVDYPYLPSPKSSESKKYKLLEVTNDFIKVERDGAVVAISIPHIKTLIENMKDDVPLDVEKTLGSGGNTRSIEESVLCLTPKIYYTRINNRKHIVESSKSKHDLGILEEWQEYPSAKDLGLILKKMYDSAEDKQQVVSIHMFAIKYGRTILEKNYKPSEIISFSGLNESYSSEITKGINIYKYLSVNPDFLQFKDDKENSNRDFNFVINAISQFSISKFTTNSLFPRYIRSLLSKPFVILSGNSGTGKTRIASRFAKYLEKKNDSGITNHLLIPVGADWTDNTKILGYYNPLADNGTGKYEKTDVFKFIELAGANPEIPFFLILDEMNLSHVERYFSDFLSKMELLDYTKPAEKVYFDITGYGKLELPKNLFITGTVNIDETTYMFSPKVLDRANVIEFKPDMDDVLNKLFGTSSDDEEKIADPGVAEGFMQLANELRSGTIPPEVQPILSDIKTILSSFYKELEKCGFEFAYRTIKEIRLYAIAAYKTAVGEKPTATEIADVQILQKILPKIHGNKKQIGNLLDELEKLCEEKSLPNSLSKIQQMKDKLNRFQYASFI